MFDVVIALQTVLNRSAKQAIDAWLGPLPKGAAWHLISDYVFGDPDRHDTAAFVLLLHHGRLEEILEYINNQAPVDIKKSRSASEGLIRYLRSPVAFSYTFVLDEGDAFFKTYASLPEMITYLDELGVIASSMGAAAEQDNGYFAGVHHRLASYAQELRGRSNARLARQVFLVAAYAAVVLDYLDQCAQPTHISWASDRDAILQRQNGIVWDIASITFFVLKGQRLPVQENGRQRIDTPRLLHIRPEDSGPNYLDPLIRMPDYLAAAGSDMNLTTFEFSHPKFESIGTACFLHAPNGVLCTLSWSGEGFLIRRIARAST